MKIAYLILANDDVNKLIDLPKIFILNIYFLNRLLTNIVSDRDR
jgi:hypothetical protein